jgi:hypothetical protein
MEPNGLVEHGKLNVIPVDLLGLFLAKLDAFEVARLYCCGALLLRQSLHYALEEVYVRMKRAGGPHKWMKKFRWPARFLLRFPRLKSLFLDLGPEYYLVDVYWKCIPSTLESIHLVCSNAWTILYDPLPPHLWFEETRREYPKDETEVIDLQALLPNLKSLVLHGWHRASSNPLVNDRIVQNLPPSITNFEPPFYVNFTDIGIANLPINLRSLVINGSKRVTEAGLSKLPPALVRLHMEHHLFVDEFTKGLSNALTVLSLRSKLLTEQCVPLLPRSIIWLSIDYIVVDWTSKSHHFFPSGLTYLKCWRTINLTDEDVKFLPRQLETLILHEAMSFSDDGIIDLPPTLKHLDVNIGRLFSDRCIPNLPRELKSLAFHWTNKITGESAHLLPPSLTYLALPECQYFEDHHIQFLPRTLTSLSLRRADLSLTCRHHLPPNLELLNVADPKLSSQFKQQMREKEETVPVCSIQ